MHAFAFRRARLRAVALSGVLSVAGFAACIDPIHIYPAGTGGASTSTGSAAPACRSNADCTFPTAVCDTAMGACVGCLVVSNCAYAPNLVCNKGTCECSPDAMCDAGSDGGGTGGSDGGVPEAGDDAGPDA